MKTLFIDTHYRDIIIVLLENGKVVDKEEVINKKNNSEYIFPTIIKVIAGILLDEIIVVNGPGSLTGVRLGVTIAKTLAYTLNIPIKCVSSLQSVTVSTNALKVALSDENGYYVGLFASDYKLVEDYTYVDSETFKNMNHDNSYETNYSLDMEKIYDFVKNNVSQENVHGVKPIYVKKIGALK